MLATSFGLNMPPSGQTFIKTKMLVQFNKLYYMH